MPFFHWPTVTEAIKQGEREQIYSTKQKSKCSLTSMLSVPTIQYNKANSWKGTSSDPTWGPSSHPAKAIFKLCKLQAVRHGFTAVPELCEGT